MRKIWLMVLAAFLLSGAAVSAQSYRVQNLSDKLVREADELAERTYVAYTMRDYNSRLDFDNLMLAQQLRGTAAIFQRFVRDRRAAAELRDTAILLSDHARKFPTYSASNLYWDNAKKSIDDISRELNGGANSGEPPAEVIGRVRWRGMVDDEVQLRVQYDQIETRLIFGDPQPQAIYNFTTPLPSSKVKVYVKKIDGRGDVKVLQQPEKSNEYSSVIQIRDKKGGARNYEIEIYWTR